MILGLLSILLEVIHFGKDLLFKFIIGIRIKIIGEGLSIDELTLLVVECGEK